MKVLYVSKASYVAAHRDKLRELVRLGVDLTLVVPEKWGSVASEGGVAGYTVVRLPVTLNGHNHLHTYRGLGRVFEGDAFDLVHIDEEPYSLVTAQVLQHALRARVPALFFAWQNIDKRIPLPFRILRSRVFARAAGGIAGNQEAADVLRAWGFEGPLAVIPQMGVDPDRFVPDATARQETRMRIGVGDDVFLVGYAGRLVREKGVDLLLDAVAENPGVHALVIGAGPEAGVLKRRSELEDLRGRVVFAADVPSLEMPRWLSALDCLVLPSRTLPTWKEQFGRVLIEAMACGVPVIGSSSGEISNVIGGAGLVFPEGDLAALSARLGSLDDPTARATFAKKGRERVLAAFTQERVARDTVAFYEKLRVARADSRAPVSRLAVAR